MHHQNDQRSPTAQPMMEPSPQFSGGSPDDPKKNRIAKACEACRRKKIKCDGLPFCTNCTNYKRECIYRTVEQKRARPKGARYIETLEKRLERMESLLSSRLLAKGSDTPAAEPGHRIAGNSRKQRSDTVNSDSHANLHLGKPLPVSPGEASAYSTVDSSPSAKDPEMEEEPTEEEIERLSDRMYTLMTNNWGEAKFIGSSSSFSIFSPDSIEWINEKTGDTALQEILTSSSSSARDNNVPHLGREFMGDLFRRPIYEPLPTKEECLALLDGFFRDFNTLLPLYHQPTFMHLTERQYSADPYEGSGWWSSLNLALAIAHHLRAKKCLPAENDRKARGYLKNAMAVLAELIVQNTDLLSVQALIGMAYFMHCSSSPQPSFSLISAAIRMSHSIGLHKRGSGFNFNPTEIEQRKRVFWVAYVLDKEISLRMGRPPAQDDDDMNVELPSLEPEDNVGNFLLNDGTKVNLFRLLTEFAIIQSRIYKKLYSTEAAKQSIEKLLAIVGELDSQLEEWKTRIPMEFRPELGAAVYTPLDLHVLMLHFGYYNCLATIHRMPNYWLSRLSDQVVQDLKSRPLNPRVFSSRDLCVSAARESIYLLKYVPQADNAIVWLIIYYPLASLITLFSNILQNPQDSTARTDMDLIAIVIKFLYSLDPDRDVNLNQMLILCSEFQRMANLVLERSEKSPPPIKKRKEGDPAEVSRIPMIPAINTTPSAHHQPSGVPFPTMNNQMHRWQDHPGTAFLNGLPGGNSWDADMGTSGILQDSTISPENGMQFFDDLDLLHNRLSIGSLTSVANLNSLQQAFIPQDLMNMPMELDWDWADTFSGGYTAYDNGQSGNDVMNS